MTLYWSAREEWRICRICHMRKASAGEGFQVVSKPSVSRLQVVLGRRWLF